MLSNIKNAVGKKIMPMVRNMVEGKLEFYDYHSMVNVLHNAVLNIDQDFDVVVGIPRSGLLPASIIANMLNKSIASFEELQQGYAFYKGHKTSVLNSKILLVDDYIYSGYSFDTYKNKIKRCIDVNNIKTMAIYSATDGKVDYVGKRINGRTIFEWNMLHKVYNFEVGFDLDGVLCNETNIAGNNNLKSYINAIKNAKPFLIPSYTIPYIVTNRLEQFRDITENWLLENNVKFRQLIMWDNAWDNRNGKYVSSKIDMIKATQIKLFFESDNRTAFEINKKLGIPVICTTDMVMYS